MKDLTTQEAGSSLTRTAVERLRDKSSLVRKQAIILFRTLLENNPFAGHLDPTHWGSAVADIENWFAQNPMPTLEHVKCQLASLGGQTSEVAAESADVGEDDETDESEEPKEECGEAEQTNDIDDDPRNRTLRHAMATEPPFPALRVPATVGRVKGPREGRRTIFRAILRPE